MLKNFKPFRQKLLRGAYTFWKAEYLRKLSYMNVYHGEGWSEPHAQRFQNEVTALDSICRRILKLIQQ